MLNVKVENTWNQWHPIALVDSEPGVTHQLTMSLLYQTDITFSSQIVYNGVSASLSYSKTTTWQQDDLTPTTASNGQVKTRLSEFHHVYQSGDLYELTFVWNGDGYSPYWQYKGPFAREYVSDWYTVSRTEYDYAYQISETRAIYKGEWDAHHYTEDLTMISGGSYTGSLGFFVGKPDIFGAGAKIQFTTTHVVKVMHRVDWYPPTSSSRLKFYAGNLFDINLYEYSTIGGGRGGGCPYVSEWNGNNYSLDNNLLPQSEIYGNDCDWVDRYVLNQEPRILNGTRNLMLSEFENERTQIDRVQLLAVAHDAASHIAVDPNGNIMSYGTPIAAQTAMTSDGRDVL